LNNPDPVSNKNAEIFKLFNVDLSVMKQEWQWHRLIRLTKDFRVLYTEKIH